VRLLEKQAILKADCIEQLFRQWHEAYCQQNKKGHHDILRSFEIHVFPVIGSLPAEKVSLHEWLSLLEKHATVRPGIAERILSNAKQMLKWAVRRRLIAASALAGINAKEVFAMSAPRARKAAPLDQKQAAALLAQAAVIADRLAALPGDEAASEEGLRACRDELVLIRTCLMQVLGREP
jgi:hypothetical protein